MTCNLSHRTFFPVNEDKLVSSVRDMYMIGGMSEKNGSAYSKHQCFDWEFANSFDCGKDGVDKGGSFDSVTTDIIDLLPSDPFEMDISATITAFAGWVGDLESDRLNIMWNRTLMFQTEPGKIEVYERSDSASGFDGSNMSGCRSESRQEESALSCSAEKFFSLNSEDVHITDEIYKKTEKGTGVCRGGEEGASHNALSFALGHLGLRDLLSAERVCKSLCSAIQGDVLLWKSIRIDQSLSTKINDDALLRLTNRAQGNLLCLSMMECSKITDNCLKKVLQNNPRLTKLNVAGCTGLSNDGIVNNLKAFKSSSASTLGITHLRIGSRYGMTREHLEEINGLVGADKNINKPRYFHHDNSLANSDDDRAIDIEICPKCDNSTLVYDCPAKNCQGKQQEHICRGCLLCIERCVECGQCVNDIEYIETFCLDKLCWVCDKAPTSTIIHQGTTTRYSVELWG